MIFEVWKTTYTRDQASQITAGNHADAALEWAKRYDVQTSSQSIAKEMVSPFVYVAIAGHGFKMRFKLCGEMRPVYRAEEVRE